MNKVVYIHRRATDGVVFYVGLGSPRRPFRASRSEYWNKEVAKYGYTVEVLAMGLKTAQAQELEMLLIAEYGRRDLGEGTLVNMTDGGAGISNYKANNDIKQKSVAMEYYGWKR